MALFRKILKKEEEAVSAKKNRAVQTSQVADEISGQKNNIYGVLVRPHLTEKSMRQISPTEKHKGNQEYTFVVAKVANKNDVRRAVAVRFNVTVHDVRMLNMPGKERRRGRTIGWKSGFKKAVVVIAEGQSIEMQ